MASTASERFSATRHSLRLSGRWDGMPSCLPSLASTLLFATISGTPIEGLFVCGEMLGGLFWGNYIGGAGLAAGMVFGRRAGNLA